ncbi:MAG: L-2-hydroxyglutarate oxidase [Planctomycetes bacterium]|nr:L-2-hydroxyglutarate oxidase [Planctomycetota bacterium]
MGAACQVAVVGAGLVGLATARALQMRGLREVVVLEAEDGVARHQTGHNSGVIHSGIYYRPGSLKARLCVSGRRLMEDLCTHHGVAWQRLGKLIVALDDRELPRLDELERRGRENGLKGLRRLGPEDIREREPAIRGVGALLVQETGIVDFPGAARALAREIEEHGGRVQLGARFHALRQEGEEFVIETSSGALRAQRMVACAGLQSDRIARLCGLVPEVRIVPFRGEYYDLVPEKSALVRGLVYPVPDPRFPFLGVHFTQKIGGGVEAGPNAVLAWRREGYARGSFALRDALATLGWPGFWRMLPRTMKHGLGEAWRSWSKGAFVRALRRLCPELEGRDLVPGHTGVRAQALRRDGALVDDFAFAEAPGQVHVLNAPSPAATASLAIGRHVAERLLAQR